MSTLVTTNLKNPSNPGNNLVLEANGSVLFSAGTATVPSISFTGDLNTGIYSPGADQVAISTGGSGRLFVDASGRLGIGTSSPNYTLDVAGTINANATVRTSNGTHIGILGSEAFAAGVVGVGSTSNHPLVLGTNSLERLRITSAGLVGIGTSSPQAKLEVVGGTNAIYSLRDTGNGGLSIADFGGGVAFGTSSGGSAAYIGGSIQIRADQTWTAGSSHPSNLIFSIAASGSTTPTERLRITSAGLVGIGTSSPTQLLTVIGSSFVGSSFNGQAIGDGSAERIRIGYKDGNPDTGLVPAQILTDATTLSIAARDVVNSAIRFHTGSGTSERVRIDGAGQVGIGTSSPTENLTIYGNSSRFSVTGLTGSSAILLGNQNSGGANNPSVIEAANGALYFGGGNSWSGGGTFDYTMTLTNDNKVGIGTTNPSTSLSIGASASSSFNGGVCLNRGPSVYNFYEASDGTNTVIFGLDHTLAVAKIGSVNSYPIGFFTGNTERLRITSAGLVGVGTSAPGSILSINGTINAGNEGGLKVANNVANASFGHGLIVQMPNFSSGWGGDDNYSIAKFTDAAGTAAFIGGARSYFRGSVGIGASTFTPRLTVNNSVNGGGYADPNTYYAAVENTGVYGLTTINSGSLTTNKAQAGVIGVGRVNTSGIPGSGNEVYGVLGVASNGYGGAVNAFGIGCIGDGYISGRLGIGTTSPGHLLTVVASAGAQDIFLAGQNGISNGYRITSNGTALTHAWFNSASEAARIDSSGRLLVGTSSGSYKFQINALGSAGFVFDDTTGAIANTFGTGGNLTLRAQVVSSVGGGEIYLGGSTRGDSNINSIVLSTANTERMRIDSSGRVGIGTTSPGNANTTQVSSDGDGIRVQYANTPTGAVGPRLIFGHNTNNGTQQIFSAIKSLMASGNDADWSSHLGFYTGGSSLTERIRIPAQGGLSVGSSVSPNALTQSTGIRLGESTIASHTFTNVTTSPVTIANGVGIGGLAFVQAYNTGNGAQYTGLVMWRSGVVAVVFESNSLGFGLTYSVSGSTLLLQTASGTITGSVITFAS